MYSYADILHIINIVKIILKLVNLQLTKCCFAYVSVHQLLLITVDFLLMVEKFVATDLYFTVK